MQFIRAHRRWFQIGSLLVLLALVLFFKVDLRETVVILTQANLWLVALALLLFIPFLIVKAWRWQVILRDLGVSIPFTVAVRLYALGLGAGMLTPGNVGDAIKIAYFRNRGFSQSVISVVLDRLWDVLILLLLAATGIFIFSQIATDAWVTLALMGAGILVLLALTIHPRTQRWIFELLLRFRNNKSEELTYEAESLSPRQILIQFALSVFATLIVYLRLYLVTISVGVFLAPLPFVASMSLASIAALLAIAPGGVGPREALLLVLAPTLGISGAQALAISALIFLLQLENGIIGFVVWFFWKPDTAGGKLRTGMPPPVSAPPALTTTAQSPAVNVPSSTSPAVVGGQTSASPEPRSG